MSIYKYTAAKPSNDPGNVLAPLIASQYPSSLLPLFVTRTASLARRVESHVAQQIQGGTTGVSKENIKSAFKEEPETDVQAALDLVKEKEEIEKVCVCVCVCVVKEGWIEEGRG